jgi:diacylglycerol kinase family enzyme
VARALLIANPAAARTDGGVVREIERVFNMAGWQVETLATGGPGDARQLAEYGVQQSMDIVAVLGGDGTIMQAAAAMVGSEVPLGILPGGTGNQLAGNLRLSLNPVRAATALVQGTPKPFDLGRIERADGVHYFAVAGGAGLDARVMADTRSSQKRRWGQLAYLATTLRLLSEAPSVSFRIVADGVTHEYQGCTLLIANCGEIIPPLLKLGQGITPYDGMLDVIVVKASSVGGGLRAVWDVVRETQGVYGETVFAARVTGAHISIETPGSVQPVQLDGELMGDTPLVAEAVAGAIHLIHPKG